MATLYEINNLLMECIDLETGEIIDIEKWENACIAREQKLENIALWIKNLESDAVAYANEKQTFAAREKQALAKAESLKKLLSNVLQGTKFETAKCSVMFRKSTAVEVNEDTLPMEWYTEKRTLVPDKTLIKNALKAGQQINGARLVEHNNIQIK